MSRALAVAREADREKAAGRLLKSSADKFYDPDVDIDWNAPLVEGKYFQPDHRISLYGTYLWDRLTPEQRIELGKHEIASIASNGIWFEVLLMQMLLRVVYSTDPTTRHAQYALTEIADECRHSTMFANALSRFDVPAYGPRPYVHQLAKALNLIAYGPAMYASILVAEEVLDRLQRESMADESVQPLIRMVNRIHVLEEARHVTFARQEVASGMVGMGRTERAYQRFVTGLVSFHVVRGLINPRVYSAVGLDPKEAAGVALNNPYHRETISWAGERITGFLDDAGLIGAPAMPLWHKSFLIEKY
jgi:hypothetical protein